MQRRFYRRVWTWNLARQVWELEVEESLVAFNAFDCRFDLSWCQQPQPYVYEQWWQFVPDTIGTGQGTWSYLHGRVNWGNAGEVD